MAFSAYVYQVSKQQRIWNRLLIEGKPYGKEEEEERDKEIDDVPEIWSLPPETLTWVPAPVSFVVIAEVGAGLQQSEVPSSHKVLSPPLPPVFLNDQPVEGEEEEERKPEILSHLRWGRRPLSPEERFHYWVSDTNKPSMNWFWKSSNLTSVSHHDPWLVDHRGPWSKA